jgi:site-specific DNA recombinase
MIFDDAGNQMSPIRADRGARRYRYYVSHPQKEGAGRLSRLPAPELEKLVIDKTLEALKADVRTSAFAMKLAGHGEIARRQLLRGMIRRVEVGQSLIRLRLDGAGCRLFAQPGPVVTADLLRPLPIGVEIPINIQTLPADGLPPEPVDPHPAIIKALVRAYLWRTELMSGRTKTLGELITKVRFPRNYVLRVLRLGFLVPDLIEAILNGTLPLAVNLEALRHPIPLDWAEQRGFFGLPADQHFSSSAPAAEIIHFPTDVSGQIRTDASQGQQ